MEYTDDGLPVVTEDVIGKLDELYGKDPATIQAEMAEWILALKSENGELYDYFRGQLHDLPDDQAAVGFTTIVGVYVLLKRQAQEYTKRTN